MKKQNFWDRFGPKLSRHYVQIMAVVLVSACMVTPAFALDDNGVRLEPALEGGA